MNELRASEELNLFLPSYWSVEDYPLSGHDFAPGVAEFVDKRTKSTLRTVLYIVPN